MGMALGGPSDHPEFFEYFLNPANHKAGIPLDFISYHFYAIAHAIADHRRLAIHLLRSGRWISQYGSLHREHPQAALAADQNRHRRAGRDSAHRQHSGRTRCRRRRPTGTWPARSTPISISSFRGSRLTSIGESQLIGYPTQFPSVSMMDWENNKPNARFWVLKLLKDSFHPGDKLVETIISLERPGGAGLYHASRSQAADGEQAQSRARDHAARCRQGQRAYGGCGRPATGRRAA